MSRKLGIELKMDHIRHLIPEIWAEILKVASESQANVTPLVQPERSVMILTSISDDQLIDSVTKLRKTKSEVTVTDVAGDLNPKEPDWSEHQVKMRLDRLVEVKRLERTVCNKSAWITFFYHPANYPVTASVS